MTDTLIFYWYKKGYQKNSIQAKKWLGYALLIIIYKFLIIMAAINIPINSQKAPSSFPIFSLDSYFLKKNKVPMAIKKPLIIQTDKGIISNWNLTR